MDSKWYKGYRSAEDRDRRTEQLKSFRPAFDELRKVLMESYEKKPSVRDYSSPNWAERQIATNEYNQALTDLLNLIDIKD